MIRFFERYKHNLTLIIKAFLFVYNVNNYENKQEEIDI